MLIASLLSAPAGFCAPDAGRFPHWLENNSDGHTTLGRFYDNVLRSQDGLVLFIHDDVNIGKAAIAALEAAASELPEWGAIGILGWRAGERDAVRCWDGPHEVQMLDACALLVDARHGLRFDRTFDGYHCAAEDYCLQAAASGRKIWVAGPFPGHHLGRTSMDHRNPRRGKWLADYELARAQLFAKWPAAASSWRRDG